MKTATENGAQAMTLKEYFAQNPDVIVFKEKVERGRENMRKAGLTPEILRNLREQAKNNQLSKPKELTADELEDDTYNFIWSMTLELGEKDRLIEQEKRSVTQLRKELEKKDRLIADLRRQLESLAPAAI